jgi:hypothetical protein
MIGLCDTVPDSNVAPAEYIRLLCYPRGWTLEGRALELAELSRNWYAVHGRPWVFACEDAGAVIAAVSAGPEVADQVQRLWTEEKPDEYFFLHAYAAAVVEHLLAGVRARLGAFRWAGAPPDKGRGLAEGGGLPGPLEVLDSGMLRPKFSQVVLFRPALGKVDTMPCNGCGLTPCDFRRTGDEGNNVQ